MATKSSNFRHENKNRDAQLFVYYESICISLHRRSFGFISDCLIASIKRIVTGLHKRPVSFIIDIIVTIISMVLS